MRKIVIAPWGDYRAWSEVSYMYRGKTTKARTTLRALCEDVKPDAVLIFLQDTLFRRKKDLSNYQELISSVKTEVGDFINKELGEWALSTKIAVLPGIGKFKSKDNTNETEFCGQASDIYYFAFFEVVDFICNTFPDTQESMEVYFDSSHGLNYVTTTLFSVVYEVLKIFSFISKITFITVNSDPVTRGINSAEVHEIHKIKVHPEIYLDSIRENTSSVFKPACSGFDMRSIEKTVKDKRELYAFLNSFRLALPLITISLKPNTDDLGNMIKRFLEVYKEKVEIKQEGNTLTVERRLSFTSIMELLLKSWLLSRVLDLSSIHQREEVSFDHIKYFTDHIYKEKWDFEYEKINRDLGELTRIDNTSDEWSLYGDLLQKRQSKEGFNRRDLIAHSGLLYVTTEVRHKDGKLWLRIRKDKVRGIIDALA